MKNPILRMVLSFAFLLTLVGISGGINPLIAYAAPPPPGAVPAYRVDCNPNSLWIYADSRTNTDCFAGSTAINVNIYNVNEVCTGLYIDASITGQNDGQGVVEVPFSAPHTCYTFNNINHVLSIAP